MANGVPAQPGCRCVTNWWLFLRRMLCINHGLRTLWLCPFQRRARLPGDNNVQLAASPRSDDPLGLCQVRPSALRACEMAPGRTVQALRASGVRPGRPPERATAFSLWREVPSLGVQQRPLVGTAACLQRAGLPGLRQQLRPETEGRQVLRASLRTSCSPPTRPCNSTCARR